MSDDESVEVDSEAEEEEGAQDASAASTSASTPQPAPQQATPAKLQELLQLRAKQAIEGAKARHVVRENQRMADDYVHSLLRRTVQKLGWLEDEKRHRDRSRKKNQSWVQTSGVPSDRPSRRRERKREFRNRQSPEYEEVPGGGQFLLMLLGKNGQTQQAAGKSDKDEGDKDPATVSNDPAILQVSSMAWLEQPQEKQAAVGKATVEAPPGLGKAGRSKAPPAPVAPALSGGGKSSGSKANGKSNGGAAAKEWATSSTPNGKPHGLSSAHQHREAAELKGTGKGSGGSHAGSSRSELASAASSKGSARAAARAEASERRRAMGAAVAAEKLAALEAAAKKAAKATNGEQSRSNGAPVEQLNLQSLLRGAGITEIGPDDSPARHGKSRQPASPSHTSSKSPEALGQGQKPIGPAEDKAAPLIPPMPGFATIWGTPSGSAPSSSPAESPWLGSAGDPWAPLPPSALGTDAAAPALRAQPSMVPPPLSEVWPGQEAPRDLPEGPIGVEALETRPRGRRGGRNHRDKRKDLDKKLDLWDMPADKTKGAVLLGADLPEFFRDSAAPAFFDHILEDSSKKCGVELELECESPKARFHGGNYLNSIDGGFALEESSSYDGAMRACIGSLCLEEDDDDEIVLRGQVLG